MLPGTDLKLASIRAKNPILFIEHTKPTCTHAHILTYYKLVLFVVDREREPPSIPSHTPSTLFIK